MKNLCRRWTNLTDAVRGRQPHPEMSEKGVGIGAKYEAMKEHARPRRSGRGTWTVCVQGHY